MPACPACPAYPAYPAYPTCLTVLPIYAYLSVPIYLCLPVVPTCLCLPVCAYNLEERSARLKALLNLIAINCINLNRSLWAFAGYTFKQWLSRVPP